MKNKKKIIYPCKCDKDDISDFTYGKGRKDERIHFYCHECGSHYFNGTIYTRGQWEAWVNS